MPKRRLRRTRASTRPPKNQTARDVQVVMPHSPESADDMKLPSKPRWLLLRRPDIALERAAAPNRLDLDGAVTWVKMNKPILWIGSIFSVPEPSGLPSGYAISRSLFDLIFPPDPKIP